MIVQFSRVSGITAEEIIPNNLDENTVVAAYINDEAMDLSAIIDRDCSLRYFF